MAKSMIPWSSRMSQSLEDMRHEFDTMLANWFGEGESHKLGAFSPLANVAETDNEYEVTIDLPGLTPKDVTVEMKENQLWVSGQREEEHEEQGKTFHRIERRSGQFRRIIPLAGGVDAEGVQASYKDGVLTVRIPKTKEARCRRIPVEG